MVNLHEQDLTRVVSLVSQSLLVVPELIQHYLSWCCNQRLFPTGYACGRSHGFGQQVRNADFSYVRLTYAIFWMFSRCSRSVCCISSRKTWLLDDFDCWSMICDPTIGIYTCFNHWRLYGFARDSRSQEMLTRIIHINTPRPSSSCFIKKQSGQHCHVDPCSSIFISSTSPPAARMLARARDFSNSRGEAGVAWGEFAVEWEEPAGGTPRCWLKSHWNPCRMKMIQDFICKEKSRHPCRGVAGFLEKQQHLTVSYPMEKETDLFNLTTGMISTLAINGPMEIFLLNWRS